MKRLIVGIIIITIFITVPITAQKRLMCKDGTVHFKSEAPLELIQASTDKLKGVIDISKNTFAYSMPVNSFKGFNSPLQQEHFYENYMHVSKFANASFQGKIIEDIDFSIEGKQQVRAKGILDIHGVKQERIIPCQVDISTDQVTITTTFSVPLDDHDITIPKIVHQKIAEEILVEIEARFTRNEI